MSELTEFRKQKDEYFINDNHSPLLQDQKERFVGLKYFPENSNLRFELNIEEFPEKETIQLQTSTGDLQTYKRFGKIRFQVKVVEAELSVFSNQYGFFLPFVDSQAG